MPNYQFRLRGWFNTIGRDEEAKSLSKGQGGTTRGASGPLITFKDAIDMRLGTKATDVYMVIASVNMIRVENALYKSCPFESCKKKVIVIPYISLFSCYIFVDPFY